MNMEYNYFKLQVLYAIDTCKADDELATYYNIATMMQRPENNVTRSLSEYYKNKLISAKCVLGESARVYKLLALGRKRLDQYLERYEARMCLNLNVEPYPLDFKDGGILLPGYKGGI